MSNFSTATFSKFLKPQTEPAHLLVGGGGWGEANPTDLLAFHSCLHAHLQAPAPIHEERPQLWGGGTHGALNAPLDTVLEGDETRLSNAERGHAASMWPLAAASSLLDEAVLSTSVHLDFLRQTVKQTVSRRLYPGVPHTHTVPNTHTVAHSHAAGAVRTDTDTSQKTNTDTAVRTDTDTSHLGLRLARLISTQPDAQEPREDGGRASLPQDLSHMTSKLEAAGSHLATDFLRGVKRLRQAAAQADDQSTKDDRQPHRPALQALASAQHLEPRAVSPGKSPHLQLSARRQQAPLSVLSAIEMPSRPVLPSFVPLEAAACHSLSAMQGSLANERCVVHRTRISVPIS